MKPFGLLLLPVALVLTAADKKDVLLTVDAGPDQYPADALAQHLEGDVALKLHVEPDGALRCSVMPNPALASLRRPSCALIAARDIFGPRYVGGKPVATDYDVVVRWKAKTDNSQFGGAIPISRPLWVTLKDYPSMAMRTMNGGRVDVGFAISAMGQVEGCKVTRSNTNVTMAEAVCPLLVRRALFLPALDDKGVPRATTGVLHVLWQFCPESEPECSPPDTGLVKQPG